LSEVSGRTTPNLRKTHTSAPEFASCSDMLLNFETRASHSPKVGRNFGLFDPPPVKIGVRRNIWSMF